MTKKEINEIKGLLEIEDCSIDHLIGCYVDGEKNKVTRLDQLFLNLPEEEMHKYLDLFRKVLSGTPGRNLLDMQFTTDAYAEDGARSFLQSLKACGLKDPDIVEKFYDKVINAFDYPGNFLILGIHQTYDIPGVSNDGIEMDDASDEIYEYILAAVCRVSLTKPGLGYDEGENTFHNLNQAHIVDAPDLGFLFPAFTDRSADEDRVLFYTKDTKELQQDFLDLVLNCTIPLPAVEQKVAFDQLVAETLGPEADFETVKTIHENLKEFVEEEKKESPQAPALDSKKAKYVLEKSGVPEEKLENFEEHFEMAAGEEGKLYAANIMPARKFEVKTPDVVIKVNPDRTDLIRTEVINGEECLVIRIDENLEVNGVSVNPQTGEIIERYVEV